MKKIIAITALATLAFTSLPAAAQTTTAQAQSGSQSQAASQSQGGSVTLNSGGNSEVRYRGGTDSDLTTVPSLGGLALGGGHPCAYSPATGQLVLLGGGAGFGGMQIDSACLLLVQAVAANDRRAYQAAMLMIAARDPAACDAMEESGFKIVCAGDNKIYKAPETRGSNENVTGTTLSTNSGAAGAEPTKVAYRKCEYDQAANKITFKRKSGFDAATAKAACMAHLGF